MWTHSRKINNSLGNLNSFYSPNLITSPSSPLKHLKRGIEVSKNYDRTSLLVSHANKLHQVSFDQCFFNQSAHKYWCIYMSSNLTIKIRKVVMLRRYSLWDHELHPAHRRMLYYNIMPYYGMVGILYGVVYYIIV